MTKGAIFAALCVSFFLPRAADAKPGVALQTASGEAVRLLGYTAFGQADEISALERDLSQLQSLGVKTARPKTSDGRIELMILFLEGVGPITATIVRQKVTDGKLGHFEYETILAPESAVK